MKIVEQCGTWQMEGNEKTCELKRTKSFEIEQGRKRERERRARRGRKKMNRNENSLKSRKNVKYSDESGRAHW